MKNVLTLYFFIIALAINAQIVPIGEWQIHVPYNNGISIKQYKDDVYFMGEYGVFKYNVNTTQANKLSKISGLSDNGFSALGIHEKTGTIAIGYQNGNLDLIKGNEIINIASIRQAQNILGSKRINDIIEYGNFIFLSTDFGVVKIDVIQGSIKETYKNITIEGDVLKVNESIVINDDDNDVSNDSIFLATDIGLMSANLSSTNLIDYNQWQLYDSTNTVSEEEAYHLCEFNNRVYALSRASGVGRRNDLFIKTNESWRRLPLKYNPFFPWLFVNDVFVMDNKLYLSNIDGVYEVDKDGVYQEKSIIDGIFTEPKSLFRDSKGTLFAVDQVAGFFKQESDNSFNFFNQNGPYFSETFHIESIDNEIYVASGGYIGNALQPSFSRKGYYKYDYDRWETFTERWDLGSDIVDFAKHRNRDEIYIASYSHGLLLLDKEGNYTLFTDSSEVTTASPSFISPLTPSYPRVRIPCVQTDNNGDVWFTNYLCSGNSSLFRINTDGTWSDFDLNHVGADYLKSITFDKDNNLWCISNSSVYTNGLILAKEDGQFVRFLSESDIGSKPNCTAIDSKGDVWLGTNAGIYVFPETDDMSNITVDRPIVDGRYLLEEEIVTSIVIDGANRKWIGTANGLWLFNEDGTEQLAYFNIDNSPLLSNRIQTLAWQEETGDLFIGTDFGIISYRTSSTQGALECDSEIKVFPNPVRPEFNGLVGIDGVAENSIVKITDLSGRLVYETTALGGQAAWNTLDLNGNEVKSGVYTVYISSEDGEYNCNTKIAVIE